MLNLFDQIILLKKELSGGSHVRLNVKIKNCVKIKSCVIKIRRCSVSER